MENDIFKTLELLKLKLEIDEYLLENEARNQSLLYAEIGEYYVDAKSEVKDAKKDLDFIQSDLDQAIRINPEKFGISGRGTEAAILSTIHRDEKYRSLFEEHLLKQKIADSFQILLTAVEERKSMIRDLTSLYTNNYYEVQSDKSLARAAVDLGKSREDDYMKIKEQRRAREQEIRHEETCGSN